MKTNIMIFGLSIGIIAIIILMSFGYWKMSSEFDSIQLKLIKIQNNLPTATTATTTSSTITSKKTTTATEEFKPKCDEYEYNFMIWVKCRKIRTEEEMNTFIDKIRSTRKYEDFPLFSIPLFGILFILICFCVEEI